MDQTNNSIEATDSLRLDRCPDCGYSRQGLPEGALCPECGFACSADLIVLYAAIGSSLAATVPGGMARVYRFLASPWMVAVWVGMAFGFPYLEDLLPPGFNIGTFVGLFFIGLAIYHRWRLRRDELQARWQLRLCAAGFAQREFLGPAPLHPWGPDVYAEVKIESLPPLRRLRRRWSDDMRWVTIGIGSKDGRPSNSRMLAYMSLPCDKATARRLRERVDQWQVTG